MSERAPQKALAALFALLVVGVAIAVALAHADAPTAASPPTTRSAAQDVARNERIQRHARARFEDAKDPVMKFVAQCLADRGATYDPVAGAMRFAPESDSDRSALTACLDDLAEDRPFRKH